MTGFGNNLVTQESFPPLRYKTVLMHSTPKTPIVNRCIWFNLWSFNTAEERRFVYLRKLVLSYLRCSLSGAAIFLCWQTNQQLHKPDKQQQIINKTGMIQSGLNRISVWTELNVSVTFNWSSVFADLHWGGAQFSRSVHTYRLSEQVDSLKSWSSLFYLIPSRSDINPRIWSHANEKLEIEETNVCLCTREDAYLLIEDKLWMESHIQSVETSCVTCCHEANVSC